MYISKSVPLFTARSFCLFSSTLFLFFCFFFSSSSSFYFFFCFFLCHTPLLEVMRTSQKMKRESEGNEEAGSSNKPLVSKGLYMETHNSGEPLQQGVAAENAEELRPFLQQLHLRPEESFGTKRHHLFFFFFFCFTLELRHSKGSSLPPEGPTLLNSIQSRERVKGTSGCGGEGKYGGRLHVFLSERQKNKKTTTAKKEKEERAVGDIRDLSHIHAIKCKAAHVTTCLK